jgi:deoxyribonuclease V
MVLECPTEQVGWSVEMKAALDVCYHDATAIAACVVFEGWLDDTPVDIVREAVSVPRRYRPGRFFERELPCLLAVLSGVRQRLDTILIDGYVHLTEGKGLGASLHDALASPTVVIGVAKNPLAIADRFVPILRGRGAKPLYVSAIGCPLERAAAHVASMHGPYRIPTLLRLADRSARRT